MFTQKTLEILIQHDTVTFGKVTKPIPQKTSEKSVNTHFGTWESIIQENTVIKPELHFAIEAKL